MASYESFKKISVDQIPDGEIQVEDVVAGLGVYTNSFYVYNTRLQLCQQCANAGNCCCQYCGSCCQWTVPTNVTKATFEIWSGGGGGAGNTCCCYHSSSIGGAGGNYASKTISVTPGSTYTICAGGSWPCNNSRTCTAGMGCKSFVTGTGLDNFCANGGCGGWMANSSSVYPNILSNGCANCSICSGGCGIFGADFGIMGTVGMFAGRGHCSCYRVMAWSGTAPMIGLAVNTSASNAGCSCGCYTSPVATGGASGTSSCCRTNAKCCAVGIGGASGMVKVTYA